MRMRPSFVFMILFLFLSFGVRAAESQSCQYSRETILAIYREAYVRSLDRQIYPQNKNVNKIVSPARDPDFKSLICSQVKISSIEMASVQADAYARFFGKDDSSEPSRALLRNFLIREMRGGPALAVAEAVDQMKVWLLPDHIAEEEKYSRVIEFAKAMPPQVLRLFLDSTSDLFNFVANSDLVDISLFLQLLKQAYPSPEEMVKYLVQYKFAEDDDEFLGRSAAQIRALFLKSLQMLKIDQKNVCAVSQFAFQSQFWKRDSKEYEELVNTLYTIFPRTEEFEEIVCSERESPPQTVKDLRQQYLDKISKGQFKARTLNISKIMPKVPQVLTPAIVKGSHCVENEFRTKFAVEMKMAPRLGVRYIFGFIDSKGCHYGLNIEQQISKNGNTEFHFHVRVSNPFFVVADLATAPLDKLADEIVKKMKDLGVIFEFRKFTAK